MWLKSKLVVLLCYVLRNLENFPYLDNEIETILLLSIKIFLFKQSKYKNTKY